MNVLYTNFHKTHGGGHTVYVFSLLKYMPYKAFVACPPTSLLYSTLSEQGFDRLIPIEFPGKPRDYKAIIKNTLALKKAIEEHDIDIVHTNGSNDNRMALYASLLCRKKFKVVFTKHNAIKIQGMISRLRLRRFNDAVIFVGDIVEYLGLRPHPRFHVIPNGIDLDFWRKKNPVATGRRLTLVSHAGVGGHKGWQHLIQALAMLTAEERDRFTVVMLARYEKDMAQELAEAPAVCDFRFPGFLKDVRPELECGDIGFVLSYKEACSFACREMMALGMPVITSDFMVLVDTITPGCGWVTKTGEAHSILKALREILAMRPEEIDAMKRAARKKAESHFGIERMVAQTSAVYEGLMGRSSDPFTESLRLL